LLNHPKIFKKLKVGLFLISLSFSSLLTHKLRAALSILGVICGVMAVLAMLSKKEAIRQIEQLGTRNIYLKAVPLTENQKKKAVGNISKDLSIYDADRIINGCKTVRDIAYLKEITASITGMPKEISPQIAACSPGYARVLNLHIYQGRFITDEDVLQRNPVCIIGDTVAKNLGIHGKTGSYMRIENSIFKVVGVLKRYDISTSASSAVSIRNFNDMVFIPFGTERGLRQIAFTKERPKYDGLTEIVIQMDKTEQVIGSVDIIKRILEVSHGDMEDYQIVIPLSLLRQSQQTQRTFNIVLGSIAGISMLVGGIGIMNIMLATVTERTREIGIRLAVGATQKNILIQFLGEAIILTLSGGIIGIASGIGCVRLITSIAGWKTALSLWAVVLPLLMSIIVGIFSGLYPAYRASRLDPIAAIRYE